MAGNLMVLTERRDDAPRLADDAPRLADDAPRLADEALLLGTRDPQLVYRAGMIASAAGEVGEAERLLSDALELDPGFSASGAAAARPELERLQAAPKPEGCGASGRFLPPIAPGDAMWRCRRAWGCRHQPVSRHRLTRRPRRARWEC